jgi:ankyrin repeat protein
MERARQDAFVDDAMRGRVDAVERALTKGHANVNGVHSVKKTTALHGAVRLRQTQMVRLLLSRGASPNLFVSASLAASGLSGETATWLGAQCSSSVTLKCLLDAGGDPNGEMVALTPSRDSSC